jgi:lipoprotein-anchoring transpeptidase ErfK/SrfK
MQKRTRSFMAVLAISAVILAGCSQPKVLEKLPLIGTKVDPQAELVTAFGPIDQRINLGGGQVLLSPAKSGGRALAYATQTNGHWQLSGPAQMITENADTAKLTLDGNVAVVSTLKEGKDQLAPAPQFAGYEVGATGLTNIDYYERKAPAAPSKVGHAILVNKRLNVLYHYQDGKLIKAYRVATGHDNEGTQPTWDDFKTNLFTPEGTFTLTNFVTNPPFNALKPGDASFAGGGTGNPLGTRWMGFVAIPNDSAWIYGIHGTSHPESIGTWASDGCIRMFTAQAEELFALIKGKNATLQVVHQ